MAVKLVSYCGHVNGFFFRDVTKGFFWEELCIRVCFRFLFFSGVFSFSLFFLANLGITNNHRSRLSDLSY